MAVVAVPAVISSIGFTNTGIAAGSAAASLMSSAAIANGGGVAAGSAVAIAQSIGAVGLGPVAVPLFLAAAAVTGLATYIIVGHIKALPGTCSKGVKKGMYMVLLEEGMCNVCFYAFDTEAQAWGFGTTWLLIEIIWRGSYTALTVSN